MFLFPVWVLLIGSILVLLVGSLKAGRTAVAVTSFLTALSAAVTLVPFLFFSQPRTVGYFRDLIVFRIEPFASATALCLSLSAAGLTVWLAVYYREPKIDTVLALSLLAMGFSAASIFAASVPTMALFTFLTFLTLLLLRKKIGD